MTELVRINLITLESSVVPSGEAARQAVTVLRGLMKSMDGMEWEGRAYTAYGGPVETAFRMAERLVVAWGSDDKAGMRTAADALVSSWGDGNLAVGMNAAYSMTSGTHNFALGPDTLRDVTDQSYLFAVGTSSEIQLGPTH